MKYQIKNIHLELTSKCNLKCVHCALNVKDYESQKMSMNYESVMQLLYELKPKRKNEIGLTLQGVGEATLSPVFYDVLKEAHHLGYRVSTTSNLLAVDKEKYKEFLENGLNKLTISIDTIDQKRVQDIRKGTDVKKLKENLSYLAKIYPDKLHIYTVVSDQNINLIDELYFFLKENGIQTWQFIYLDNFDGTKGISEKNKIVLDEKVKQYSDIKTFIPLKEIMDHCDQPMNILHVNSMGFIMPCGLHWDHNVINFGNISNNNIIQKFNSEKFNEFRDELVTGRNVLCNKCTTYKPYLRVDCV